MTGHLLACAALFPASLLPAAAIAITCALRKRRAGGQQVPGAGPAPVPGSTTPPARQRQLPAPAPGSPPDHGGDVKVIVVKRDGRVETTDCATGHTEIWPGDCAECTTGQGMCSLCAYWTVFDPLRGRWVRRYQRCPAHADKERQP